MPKLLDLFSGAGGAAMGYSNAGFEVAGVDHEPQNYYPFEFHQADVFEYMDYIERFGGSGPFVAVHASPPCQPHTVLRNTTKRQYEDLVPATRDLLRATGLPYVIEGVPGTPLIDPIVLCGDMFGLKVKRHRLFESNVRMVPPVCLCARGDVRDGRKLGFMEAKEGDYREAMGCDWMSVKASRQAIPPRYTEWVGGQLLEHLDMARYGRAWQGEAR